MLARDLMVPFPAIGMNDDALAAARLMAEQHLPGIVVCEPDGRPTRMLPGPDVLRFVIPQYVQDDSALARVIGERGADRLLAELRGRKVRDLLPERGRSDLVVAAPDDTVLELCVLMARAHSPLVAVVEDNRLLGCVTLPRVLDVLLAAR
ncbi:CBS domain-containing protein [Modestobacter sp. DSM 44400]|uniref:CBS domain-containing protein n=1 Tax=Modestobacter sp. DSM 44400 TaxID=1550230 RepID=UPI00089AABA3|nr:CBS domain-containing protein [Modestobacter sp. DSM 44400]SDY10912.1 CBS domain-containing protein [Modestobacter sp. DSM 44400]